MAAVPAQASGASQHAVGVYLAAVQFLFALCWVVYVAYLPQLVRQLGGAGLESRIVPWILAFDQLVFIVTDLIVGAWSDRAARVLSRISRWILAATLLSGLAFATLPLAAASGSPLAFGVATFVWAVTSSALRAPPLTLLGRHVAKPAQPTLVALSALGLGLCNAAAPYLALQLKTVDPRVPFALSALVLAAVTLGMGRAERALSARPVPSGNAAGRPSAWQEGPPRLLLACCLLAAVGFQAHVFLVSPPLYLQHVGSAALASWLPLFWVGFNLALWPASRLTRRIGAPWALGAGAAAAALAALAAQLAPGLAALAAAQVVAGAAWALALCGAFCSALALGHTGREGFFNGALQSILASGALARLLIVALFAPAAAQVLAWGGVVVVVFAAAAVLMAWGLRRLRGWPTAS